MQACIYRALIHSHIPKENICAIGCFVQTLITLTLTLAPIMHQTWKGQMGKSKMEMQMEIEIEIKKKMGMS